MQQWVDAQLQDLIDIRDQLAAGVPAAEVHRPNRPKAMAVGVSERQEWARGLVWDCRQECCVPLDFHAPFSSNLNLQYLEQML